MHRHIVMFIYFDLCRHARMLVRVRTHTHTRCTLAHTYQTAQDPLLGDKQKRSKRLSGEGTDGGMAELNSLYAVVQEIKKDLRCVYVRFV